MRQIMSIVNLDTLCDPSDMNIIITVDLAFWGLYTQMFIYTDDNERERLFLKNNVPFQIKKNLQSQQG